MAYLPLNIFFVVLYAAFIWWGWEGEEMRQLFSVISSIFMFPLWLLPLFSVVDDSVCCTITATNGWLPTGMLEPILFWNVVLMYWTAMHLMQTAGREEPIGKGLKRLRKQR
jgi:hypothetical protein